jgi:hypothetical protein
MVRLVKAVAANLAKPHTAERSVYAPLEPESKSVPEAGGQTPKP